MRGGSGVSGAGKQAEGHRAPRRRHARPPTVLFFLFSILVKISCPLQYTKNYDLLLGAPERHATLSTFTYIQTIDLPLPGSGMTDKDRRARTPHSGAKGLGTAVAHFSPRFYAKIGKAVLKTPSGTPSAVPLPSPLLANLKCRLRQPALLWQVPYFCTDPT